MKFEYEALDGDGRLVRGMLEAEDFKDVLRKLVEKRLHPMGVSSQTSSGIEIERLKKFRQKLQPQKKPKLIPTPIIQPAKEKWKIDWTYAIFLVFVIGLIAAAIFRDDLAHLRLLNPTTESHQHNER